MDFSIKDQGDEKQIALSGTFTFADNKKFKQMMAAINDKYIKTVALDFAAVEFIDSGALGMLLLFRDECLSKHITVSLRAAQGQVDKIFKIAKFDQLFSVHGEK